MEKITLVTVLLEILAGQRIVFWRPLIVSRLLTDSAGQKEKWVAC
jgi:hypothetical protein